MESTQNRARTLIKQYGVDRIGKETAIPYSRWVSVTYKNVRMSTEELDELKRLFPQYAYWLITGEVIPEAGQTSPDYDSVDSKLAGPAEG